MAYGAVFTNADGKRQLGPGISNYFMAAKGTVAVNTASAQTLTFNITPGVAYDCIAVYASGGFRPVPQGMFASTKAAGTATLFFGNAPSAGNFTVTWFAFRSYKSLAPATSGWELQIRDPIDGTVGFLSHYPKILKVALQIPVVSAAPFNVTLPNGKACAFLAYGMVRRLEVVPSPGGDLYFGYGPSVDSNFSNANVNCDVLSGPMPPAQGSVFAGGLLAVDVSNY